MSNIFTEIAANLVKNVAKETMINIGIGAGTGLVVGGGVAFGTTKIMQHNFKKKLAAEMQQQLGDDVNVEVK